jgi:hypothetical protein
MYNKHVPALNAHKLCLVTLFLLPEIINGFSVGKTGFFEAVIIFVVLLFFMPLLLRLFNLLFCAEAFRSSGSAAGRAILTAIYAAAAAASLYFAGSCADNFAGFCATVIIPDAPLFWVELAFIAAAVWLSMKDTAVIFKFALVISVVVFTSVIALFVLSLTQLRPDAASLFKSIDTGAFLDLKSWIHNPALTIIASLPVILALVACLPGKADGKSVYPGIFLGFLLLLICAAQTLLVFDENYLATLSYPYLSSVGILSADEVFLRMDGFVYITFYALSLIKTAACFSAVRLLCSKYNNKAGFYAPAACGVIIVIYNLIKII